MLGLPAASKITYARPVGGLENTSNIGDDANINNLAWPPRPSPEPSRRFFGPKLIYGTFLALKLPWERARPSNPPQWTVFASRRQGFTPTLRLVENPVLTLQKRGFGLQTPYFVQTRNGNQFKKEVGRKAFWNTW